MSVGLILMVYLINEFTEIIDLLNIKQVTADLAPGFVRDVGADKVDFKFKKPKTIKIGGSYCINCVVKPGVNVDLFIGLPKVFLMKLSDKQDFYHCHGIVVFHLLIII